MKRSTIGWLWVALYGASIVAANLAVRYWGVVPVGFGLVAPAGVYFAGLCFAFRDAIQDTRGRTSVIGAIIAGAVISALFSPQLALASGVAFLVSEALDMAVYTPIAERRWLLAVAASNVVGAVVDSALFLMLAFGSLQYFAGQVVGKLWATAAVVLLVMVIRRSWRRRPAWA